MNNNNKDDRQFYTAYHLFKPLLKKSDRDLPSEILPRIEGVEHSSDSLDRRSSRRIFGNPNIFRIFRFSITFTERLFQKPNFVRILIHNRTSLWCGSCMPNIMEMLREIWGLAANYDITYESNRGRIDSEDGEHTTMEV